MFESEDMGTTDRTGFIRAIHGFPWGPLADEANDLGGPSATLTLRHGGLDRYLAVSPAGDSSNFVLFLFWGIGSAGEDPRFLPVDDIARLEVLLELFFANDVAEVDEIFEVHGLPMDAAFDGW